MLVAALFAPLTANASCGGVTVVDDPLDGRSIGFHQRFDRHRTTGVTVHQIRGQWTLRLFVTAQGLTPIKGDKRQRARFVVGNEVVELRALRRPHPLRGVRPKTGVYTQWRVDFDVTPTRLATLAADRIEVVGLTLAHLEHRFELSRRTRTRLQRALTCALGFAS